MRPRQWHECMELIASEATYGLFKIGAILVRPSSVLAVLGDIRDRIIQ